MRRTKALSALALFTGASLVLSACGGGGDNGTNQGDSADIASMAAAKGENGTNISVPKVDPAGDITVTTDNPYTAYNNQAADANNTYNAIPLVSVLAGAYLIDGNNKVLLNTDIMESVEVTSKSPQTVTWKMKPGLEWSDGKPFNCKDFYFTWLANAGIKKAGGDGTYFLSAGTTGYEMIKQPTCENDTTLVTTFDEPFADYPSLFGSSLDVLPAHIAEEQTGIADITKLNRDSSPEELTKIAEFWNTKWNGFDKALMPASGPYMLDSWVQNQSVKLVRNPKWKGNPGGPDSITVKAISDPTAQAQALQNGETQVMASAQPDGNAADRLRGLAAEGVKYGAAAGLAFEHLDLNFKNPLLAQDAVRKAFGQCINRQEIVQKLVAPVQEDAKPFNSIVFFPSEDGFVDNYSDKLTGKADDAKKTLEADGWTLGADGIYAKDGKKLSFRISHTDIPRRKQTVELIQGQCKAAGIEVVDDTDPNFLDTRVSQGDYDVALFAWTSLPFKSSQQSIYTTGGGQNWQGLSDPTVDENFKKAVAQTDLAAAKPFYQAVDKALAEKYATFPLFLPPNMWAFKNVDRVYFQGYYGALWNAAEWQKTS
ncbi:ABC transporter family substrate-binding protein [Goodfellowiella coeruleoviolacea]|uniref:Peptide/nickel transport system substrate-binding protein n=1 Tax=Goodfellowiella coeruleoviolacea TaxID=334858 RepID=A0AAE3GD79_9PSEU|nr:ABC transporter family substrate-binding protein [Goodfellowiella coeruleoviolacea]MCP2165633.1 peptide/nickel transport system substrate-binding protein [Goodfellowiella coeruleoviolacea]